MEKCPGGPLKNILFGFSYNAILDLSFIRYETLKQQRMSGCFCTIINLSIENNEQGIFPSILHVNHATTNMTYKENYCLSAVYY